MRRYAQFLDDCKDGVLPDYSFVDRTSRTMTATAERGSSDQHPDHHVLEGERFIATVYNAIEARIPLLWASTALLIACDEHGRGICGHDTCQRKTATA